MVKIIYLLCLCFLGISKLEADPFVDASVDSMTSQAHFPLQGTITITHSKEEKIDPQSFTMEGKPLETSFVKDVKMSASSNTLVSIYSFQLPAQDKGLYVLPSIAVKIENQTYHTTSSTYEVHEETTAPPSPSTTTSSSQLTTPTIFRLEASVEGPSILYPGERTKLFYRISYNRSIDLTRSVFPLIHPAHFQKVGDVQIRDYQLPNMTVQELTQEVEASDLGSFSLGPSLIEGYAYTMKKGQKIYDPTLLKAEAPVVTLEVKPLPELSQPSSFTGALGQIQVEALLTSSNTVSVGDILQLQVKIQGITNLTELRLPLLQCLPGFSGFFQISDLPPLAEVKEKTKFFYVDLRPLTSFIQQIPSIEVSSFDPKTKKYVIQKTTPIPIRVTAHALDRHSLSPILFLTQFPSVEQWPKPILPPLEIEGSIIPHFQMTSAWSNHSWILWMIPISIILLWLQKYWQRKWEQHPKSQIPKSEQLFRQALKEENLQGLERAFWHRLWEKGRIPPGVFQLEKIPNEGMLASIRTFLFQLQALQYSANKTFDSRQLQHNAKQLFETI